VVHRSGDEQVALAIEGDLAERLAGVDVDRKGDVDRVPSARFELADVAASVAGARVAVVAGLTVVELPIAAEAGVAVAIAVAIAVARIAIAVTGITITITIALVTITITIARITIARITITVAITSGRLDGPGRRRVVGTSEHCYRSDEGQA
jgi:hypothetical protein